MLINEKFWFLLINENSDSLIFIISLSNLVEFILSPFDLVKMGDWGSVTFSMLNSKIYHTATTGKVKVPQNVTPSMTFLYYHNIKRTLILKFGEIEVNQNFGSTGYFEETLFSDWTNPSTCISSNAGDSNLNCLSHTWLKLVLLVAYGLPLLDRWMLIFVLLCMKTSWSIWITPNGIKAQPIKSIVKHQV